MTKLSLDDNLAIECPKINILKKDASLETLLDLDGEIFPMDNGYWTKFEVSRIKPTEQIPHGIKYSLTLHDRNNTRIFGTPLSNF